MLSRLWKINNQIHIKMNKTVLVVDDDNMLRNSLTSGLRKNDFNVLSAESAENATEILNRVNVDAIILDRMLGGQDGLSFLKNIRKQGNKTPTIMLTALSGSENTIDGLSGGADDLQKIADEVLIEFGKTAKMAGFRTGHIPLSVLRQKYTVKHGISKALEKAEPDLRKALKVAGFLTRDSRVVERKHYGYHKARRSTQFSKR